MGTGWGSNNGSNRNVSSGWKDQTSNNDKPAKGNVRIKAKASWLPVINCISIVVLIIIYYCFRAPNYWSSDYSDFRAKLCRPDVQRRCNKLYRNGNRASSNVKTKIEINCEACRNVDQHFDELFFKRCVSKIYVDHFNSIPFITMFCNSFGFMVMLHKKSNQSTVKHFLIKAWMLFTLATLSWDLIAFIRSTIFEIRGGPPLKLDDGSACSEAGLFVLNLLCCFVSIGAMSFNLLMQVSLYKSVLKAWEAKAKNKTPKIPIAG